MFRAVRLFTICKVFGACSFQGPSVPRMYTSEGFLTLQSLVMTLFPVAFFFNYFYSILGSAVADYYCFC